MHFDRPRDFGYGLRDSHPAVLIVTTATAVTQLAVELCIAPAPDCTPPLTNSKRPNQRRREPLTNTMWNRLSLGTPTLNTSKTRDGQRRKFFEPMRIRRTSSRQPTGRQISGGSEFGSPSKRLVSVSETGSHYKVGRC